MLPGTVGSAVNGSELSTFPATQAELNRHSDWPRHRASCTVFGYRPELLTAGDLEGVPRNPAL